jgi:hypothetical protein
MRSACHAHLNLFDSFYGIHPVVYLLDNIYLSIGQSTQQL